MVSTLFVGWLVFEPRLRKNYLTNFHEPSMEGWGKGQENINTFSDKG